MSGCHEMPDGKVSFTFEGRTLRARPGQSLASAIMSDGTDVLSRSFKFRRPRGYTCGYDMCANCSMTVGGLPGVSTCSTPVVGGEVVHRERGWPSGDVDVLRVADLLSRWMPAGFQFRLFRRRPRLARLAEGVMARFAGGGRFPSRAAADSRRTSTTTAAPDVLVVGGGVAGCAAALGAADAGSSVTLVQRGSLGGRALARHNDVSWQGRTLPVAVVAKDLVTALGRRADIDVVNGTALAHYEDGVIPLLSDKDLVETHPKQVVVATGSYDVPALFAGNDKPGVVLADGVSKLLAVDGVVPWSRAVVLTDGERGDQLAQQLADAGVEVVTVVDRSPGPGKPGRTRGEVVAAAGLRGVRRVRVRTGTSEYTLRADLLCVALSPRPADEFVLQGGSAVVGSASAGAGRRAASYTGVSVVGSAAGWTRDDPERAYAVGLRIGESR